jgi:acyl-CoA synthetase (AMP-forming)/AMP-acid ligase II
VIIINGEDESKGEDGRMAAAMVDVISGGRMRRGCGLGARPAPGAALTEEEVVAHCRAGLASFKVPRHVRFVTEWPMSSTKVQTFRLREQLEAELEARRMP